MKINSGSTKYLLFKCLIKVHIGKIFNIQSWCGKGLSKRYISLRTQNREDQGGRPSEEDHFSLKGELTRGVPLSRGQKAGSGI